MRNRNKSILTAVLVGILGLVVGFFLGEFFVHLSNSVDFLSFLRFLGYSTGFGLDTMGLNLLFAHITFGLSVRFSVMGVVMMIVFLIIYFKRR